MSIIKPIESINKDIKNIFKLISYKQDNPIIMGSNRYSDVKYPSDFDLFEVIYTHQNKNTFIKFVHKMFKKIFDTVGAPKRHKVRSGDNTQKENIYFIDFKAGYDKELYFDNFKNKKAVKTFYKQKLKENLISETTYYTILSLLKNTLKLEEYCKNLYKLRWKYEDIMNGFINVSNNRKIYFNDLFENKSLFKIDIVSYVNERLIEFSNIFEFRYSNGVDINAEKVDDLQSLKEDMKEQYYNKNYMKAIKRLFSISKIEDNKELANTLLDIINSDAGKLSQVKANIDTCILLLEHDYTDEKTINHIYKFVDLLKSENPNLPKRILSKMNNINKAKLPNTILLKLEVIKNDINKLLQKETLKEIDKQKIIF